jgi:hypothetical protein
MRLVVEVVAGPFKIGTYEVSVAHYGEQNGDAMRDPEMTFLVMPVGERFSWHPLTYLNDYAGAYQTAASYDASGVFETQQRRRVLELATFARQWDENVREQGFLEAFRRAHQQAESASMSSDSN